MEVAKGDVDRDEHDIHRVAEEVSPELDRLAEDKCPTKQENEECLSMLLRPVERGLMPGEEDEEIIGQRPCGDSCL